MNAKREDAPRKATVRVALLVGAALLGGCAAAPTAAESANAQTNDDNNVIGGDTSRNAEIPATVGIAAGGHHACTAARVGPNLFLTAAHCVLNLGNMTTYYDADHGMDLRLPSGDVKTYPVKEAHVHPAWTEACKQTLCSVSAVTAKLDAPDIAVIELAMVPPSIPIAKVDRKALGVGDTVTITGFGCTTGVHVTDDNVAVELRSARTKIVAADAAIHEGSFVTADDGPVYSGNYSLTAGQSALCPGDSGGPLYKNGAVVGVNANYTLLPDDKDPTGVPVTNWHTRLDPSSRHQVGDWLTSLGVP